jgi:hypothetical protein
LIVASCVVTVLCSSGCQLPHAYVAEVPNVYSSQREAGRLPGELLGGPADLSSYQPASHGRTPLIYGPRVIHGHAGARGAVPGI